MQSNRFRDRLERKSPETQRQWFCRQVFNFRRRPAPGARGWRRLAEAPERGLHFQKTLIPIHEWFLRPKQDGAAACRGYVRDRRSPPVAFERSIPGPYNSWLVFSRHFSTQPKLSLMDNLKIILYPHPTLRHVSKPLKRIDAEVQAIVRKMFELMYEHRGVGLAANQVDLPYRLFIVNLAGKSGEGEELVFINPVLSRPRGLAEAEEGCLSLPELYAPVKRAEKITLDAFNLQGEGVHRELDGLFARVAQHETDHLDGKLLIDRLSTTAELGVRESLAHFEDDFQSRRAHGDIPNDTAIGARLKELEKARA